MTHCMCHDFAFLSCRTTFCLSIPWLGQLKETGTPYSVPATTYQSLSIQCKDHRADYFSMCYPLFHQLTRPYIPYPQHSIVIPSCDVSSIWVKLDAVERGGTVIIEKLREAITHSPDTHCPVVWTGDEEAAIRREVKACNRVCMLSEDIASALRCNFPYLEAEKFRKKGWLLEKREIYS